MQSDDLDLLSTWMVAPTSTSARPANFRPGIDIGGTLMRVLVEQTSAVDPSSARFRRRRPDGRADHAPGVCPARQAGTLARATRSGRRVLERLSGERLHRTEARHDPRGMTPSTTCFFALLWRPHSPLLPAMPAMLLTGEEGVMGGYRIDRELSEFGKHVRGWRMVLGLTAQQVAERAGITRDTLRKIESGDSGVGFGNVAQVLRALGVLDQTVEAVDPLGSDIGRLRAGNLAKKRAR